MFQRIFLVTFCASLCFAVLPQTVRAEQNNYPRLASYYLKYFDESDYEELYKWDLIITPPEMAYYNKAFFEQYRKRNKNGILLAYVYPAMINETDVNEQTGLIGYMYNGVDSNDWWLRGARGEKLEIWPELYAVNLTNKAWQDYNVAFIKSEVDKNLWDGVMYDTVDASISHYGKDTGIDMNRDGRADDSATVNRLWQAGMAELLRKTRLALGDKKIILINGNSLDSYQPYINGRMFESFPTPWEGNGTWSASTYQYLSRLPSKNRNDNVYVINSNTNNLGDQANYQKMRFGLTSALQGDGYFSFDYGDKLHAQTWWYDEYNAGLGIPQSPAYNLLDKNNSTIKSGLWRRDFESGAAVVNSTNVTQTYVFKKEEFEKIKGKQDRTVNNGMRVNWIKLAPNDGVVLLKPYNQIKETSFVNGSFVNVFDDRGTKVRNGFFAYQDNFPGNIKILTTDLNDDKREEVLTNGQGQISIWQKGKKIKSFYPYGKEFTKETFFAVGDVTGGNGREIVTSPGSGGGPLVKIFNNQGKALTPGFMAFDKKFKGGLNIALGDMNSDGKSEIVVAAGKGGGPHVQVYDSRGRLLSSFFAYEANFRGGVRVATGDLNNDGKKEIITVPNSGLPPLVKIFSAQGKLLGNFLAYEDKVQDGLVVSVSDVNRDGKDEILVSSNIF